MIQSSREFRAAAAFIAVIAVVLIVSPVFAVRYTITVNSNTRQGTVPHFWSRCVGTGGAQLCTDANWKAHAKIAVAEAGFQAFRGHRILSATNPITWNGSGTPTYNWAAFDQVYDFLVDTLKTVPVVELSSMPRDLQGSGGEWAPPKDFTVWGNMIREVVNHCITRYGRDKVRTWIWEVWNEWDYSGFWNGGTEAQYYQLYQKAVEGAKAADSLIVIGGPSTTGSGRLQAFVNFCNSNNVKYNALTNHCYGQQGSTDADPAAIRNDNRNRSTAIKNSGKQLLSLNTEFSSSYSGQGNCTSPYCYSMDSHVNAPFVAKCVKLVLDDHTSGTAQVPDVLSYWAISDVFDEGSWYASHSTTLFGQVFGLINQHGIRKATFNAYKMLHMMGATRLALTGGTNDNDGVDGFATVSSDNRQVAVMVYNFYKALGGQTLIDDVVLTVNNLPFPNGPVEVRHYRVDSLHSNPYGVWLKLGRPASTNTSAMDQIRTASNLAEMYTAKTITYSGGAYTETFSLPRQGLSLLLLKSNAVGIKETAPAPMISGATLSLTGTTLHVTGDYKGPIDAMVTSLDGKEVKHFSVSQSGFDLRQYLPKGTFLVRVRGSGLQFIGKVVIDK
jgi:xylan 1,4-beta-xylosidase